MKYMPMKPIKRGIKVRKCADSGTGFVVNLQVYTGKRQDGGTEHGLGFRVVRDLTETLSAKNHHVFCDNCFTSVELAKYLLTKNTYLCGTIRSNRKGFPKELKVNEPAVKRLKVGESVLRRKNEMVATTWKDKRLVHFLSTQSNPVGNDTVNRKQRDGTVVQVPSSPVVKSYNNNMGAVDRSDQMRGYYSCGRKSKKWWQYLFFFCVDVAIVNAHVIEIQVPNHRTRSFRLQSGVGPGFDRGLQQPYSFCNIKPFGGWPLAYSLLKRQM
ncbi:hypothetical protein QZH41_003873 [Actinostola sp. cb2023]|nr:hypothetical protein QZH41_003873 [Actinostola sp. cb2023]